MKSAAPGRSTSQVEVTDRRSPTGVTSYVTPIVVGLLIAAAGLVPWTLLAQVNARVRPDLPWAAVAPQLYLVRLLLWLNGSGPPRRTARQRRERLRLGHHPRRSQRTPAASRLRSLWLFSRSCTSPGL